MSNEAQPQPIQEIDVHEAQRRLAEGRAILIDVRELEEVTAAHVPGARHIPLAQLLQNTSDLPNDKELLLFCRSGNRSELATDLLTRKGLNNIVNVKGGIIAWHQAGLPIA